MLARQGHFVVASEGKLEKNSQARATGERKRRAKQEMGKVQTETKTVDVTIRGIVSPSGWDDLGNVQALCIATIHDKYYYIEMGESHREFLYYLKKFVEARGKVTTRNGMSYIAISSIKITKNPDWA